MKMPLSSKQVKSAFQAIACHCMALHAIVCQCEVVLFSTGCRKWIIVHRFAGQGDWQHFSFATAFAEPPVVVVLATGLGDPIRGVSSSGFEALLVVPPPNTGDLVAITVAWQI